MFSKFRLGLVLLACGCVSTLFAADKELQEAKVANRAAVKAMVKGAQTVKLDAQAAAGAVEVDLFKAIEDDQIAAGVVQNDMKGGRLLIQNKTDKPISVKIPAAFGTRPILAQMDGGNNQQQMFGANGMGGGGGGMGGGGGGGFMNIPPEKVTAVTYKSVCLEYGKPVPNASSAYEIAPMDEVTDKPEVKVLCENMNRFDLRAAQFAAWHMNSGVSAEYLASETVLRANGKRVPNFSAQEVQQGLALIQMSRQAVQKPQTSTETTGY